MTNELAKMLDVSGAEVGVDFEVIGNYSGRGMMGDQTAAVVVGSWTDMLAVVANLGGNVAARHGGCDHLVSELQNLRMDNLGRQVVIY